MPGERHLLGLSCLHLPNTYEKRGKSRKAKTQPHFTHSICLSWFHFSAAAAHSCLGGGSGPEEVAVGDGGGIWQVFEPGPFCSGSPNRQLEAPCVQLLSGGKAGCLRGGPWAGGGLHSLLFGSGCRIFKETRSKPEECGQKAVRV